MEIEGMIIDILEPQTGTSQRTGNPWKKCGYVLETTSQYPRKIKFDVWGEKADTMTFERGKYYSVSVDVESREFNGRWYTDLKAFSSRELEGAPGGQPGMSSPAQPPVNPYGQPQFNQPAPSASNPFGASMPDFTNSDSQEDLPF